MDADEDIAGMIHSLGELRRWVNREGLASEGRMALNDRFLNIGCTMDGWDRLIPVFERAGATRHDFTSTVNGCDFRYWSLLLDFGNGVTARLTTSAPSSTLFNSCTAVPLKDRILGAASHPMVNR